VARPGELALVLLASEGALSTKDVYERADELGFPEHDLEQLASQLLAVLTNGADIPDALASVLHNDLQAAALELEPSAARALELLRESGARGATVSGSGPAAFGLYRSASEAEAARAALAPSWSGQAIAVGAVGADYAAPRPASITSWGFSGSGQ
jgi:4-diphosphocytidyl-2-C-methyl-D-erythritol kinase